MSTNSAPINVTTTTAAMSTSIVPYLQSVLSTFNLYATCIILIPGFFLNILTLLVFLRKKFWKQSTMGYYYSASSVLSICVMVVGVANFMPTSFGHNLSLKGQWGCVLMWQARTMVILGSGYFSIVVTLDRLLNTLYINRFMWTKKISNCILFTVICLLGVFVTNIFQWWYNINTTTVVYQGRNTTVVTCTISTVLNNIKSFEAILSRIIPALANVIMNLFIINGLFKSKRRISLGHGTAGRLSNKDYVFASSLIAMNFIFFIVTLPHVVLSGLQLRSIFVTVSADFNNYVNVLFSFGAWANYLYEALPFFMNLAFNKLFRSEIAKMLKLNRVININNNSTMSGRRIVSNGAIFSKRQTLDPVVLA